MVIADAVPRATRIFSLASVGHMTGHMVLIARCQPPYWKIRTVNNLATVFYTGGNRTMVAAATIVSMAAAKKTQQNVFALYHSYNRTILLAFIWILDFHFKIVLVLRRHYLIPIRCNNGKRKMWPWGWLHHFDFQHWCWLHALMTMVALFRAGNFWHTHNWSPAEKYAYRLYDCCQVYYV